MKINHLIQKVFLSSTGKDLTDYRDAVFKMIQKISHLKCIRMEDFTAADQTPIEFCKSEVRNSDIFIGIIGHHYGSEPDGYSKSFTELEWEEARKNNIPMLMFLTPSNFKTPVDIREADEKFQNIE